MQFIIILGVGICTNAIICKLEMLFEAIFQVKLNQLLMLISFGLLIDFYKVVVDEKVLVSSMSEKLNNLVG